MDIRDLPASLRNRFDPEQQESREDRTRISRLGGFIRLGPEPNVASRHWWWTGSNDGLRNGLFTFRGKTTVAHRAVWEVAHGPLRRGQLLDVCPEQYPQDRKYCVSPFHTTLGKEVFMLEPGEETTISATALLGLLRQAESILAEVRDGLKALATP